MKKYIFLVLVVVLSASCNQNYERIDVSDFSKTEKMLVVKEGNICPAGSMQSVDKSIVEISSFQGKLLIIDFWATWCAPCIEEAPLFKKLATKYNDSDAEFISISIDDEFIEWKKYIQKKNWDGNNYWLGLQEDEALFSFVYSKIIEEEKEMILIGLPKYVIISPNGEILSNSDLRPSKPGFEKAIIKYLKSH